MSSDPAADMEDEMAKELNWTNITRADLTEKGQEAWDMYVEAKAQLEAEMQLQALALGTATEGDTFKFAYARWSQGSVGMAIDTPKSTSRSGFGGLKRPTDARVVEQEKLDAWRERQAASGRRF